MTLSRTPETKRLLQRGRGISVFILIAVIIFVIIGTGKNQEYAALSLVVIITGFILLWRAEEAPILFAGFAIAWLNASLAIFYCNMTDEPISEFAGFESDMSGSITLSLIGILFLCVGMRIGAGERRQEDLIKMRSFARLYPISTWFNLYLVALAITSVAGISITLIPSLAQVILGFTNLKWAAFYLLAYASFIRGTYNIYLLIALGIELALGFGGFFSDFKTSFIIATLAAVAAGARLDLARFFLIASLSSILLFLMVVWTVVKVEYREFVSAGSNGQVVSVDIASRFSKLTELVEDIDADALSDGVERLIKRASYVEYFGAVLNYVPSVEPHTNGEILEDAIKRPFMPRAFFPDKEIIDDTERTNKFTGGLAGNSGATSISLGYIAETYIDFGTDGMLAALLAIGCFYGVVYRYLLAMRSFNPLIGTSIAASILTTLPNIENSYTKVFGGLIASLIAIVITLRLLVPRFAPWLTRRA